MSLIFGKKQTGENPRFVAVDLDSLPSPKKAQGIHMQTLQLQRLPWLMCFFSSSEIEKAWSQEISGLRGVWPGFKHTYSL